ncbi:hypothetical protein C0995_011360 [Termitomyces sp. Mi166|nr:hypothetical protein C0995_011360 [Termitomyces sp. Mi166\
MPAITRTGFIDITGIDLLSEPSRQWEFLSRALRKYSLPIYQRWGNLPRSVLPPAPVQAMLDRVTNAVADAKQKAEREMQIIAQAQTDLGTQQQLQVNQMLGLQIAHHATLDSIRHRSFMGLLNSINSSNVTVTLLNAPLNRSANGVNHFSAHKASQHESALATASTFLSLTCIGQTPTEFHVSA